MSYLDRVIEQVEQHGGEVISIRQNRHNVIEFKTEDGRAKISVSCTHSDVNAIHQAERDVERAIDRLSTRAVEPLEAQEEPDAPILSGANKTGPARPAQHGQKANRPDSWRDITRAEEERPSHSA